MTDEHPQPARSMTLFGTAVIAIVLCGVVTAFAPRPGQRGKSHPRDDAAAAERGAVTQTSPSSRAQAS